METAAIIALAPVVEQLVTLAITVYQQIEAANAAAGTPAKPLADVLAAADAQFAQIQANSKL
jgi:hypothetical protein